MDRTAGARAVCMGLAAWATPDVARSAEVNACNGAFMPHLEEPR